MKVYFVMPAPRGYDGVTVLMHGESLPIEAFTQRSEAEAFAKQKASEQRGQQFWVIAGEPRTAFSSDPVPVFEQPPTIGDL
ncbi:hypothetical protein IB024_01325 [Brucella sp. 6810]|uniref:hypothetical protein n=1 Tax=Brucella sp. 6810 TaxID=2769351 RepID=UPI00165CCF8E|nr:hypothetical protein [Brucella sp. 6810]QNQ62430.1 hypothetical protein IB024_01325 [Brucella sp. 6810]